MLFSLTGGGFVKTWTTGKQLAICSTLLGLMLISSIVVLLLTPHTFVRALHLVVVVALSMAPGAFAREFFLLREKKKQAKREA
nr:hypothetical protein [Brevibacillus agri]